MKTISMLSNKCDLVCETVIMILFSQIMFSLGKEKWHVGPDEPGGTQKTRGRNHTNTIPVICVSIFDI